jgi:predicted nicotinamide N-methyase
VTTQQRLDGEFVRANTRLRPAPFVPEISLHLADGSADEPYDLWLRAETARGEGPGPVPFWAFVWAGGQALARHLLDHPDTAAGRTVLDLGAGSGLVAIAAAMTGATAVTTSEVDGYADAAITLNASANGVTVANRGDVLDEPPDADLILAGDVFYDREMAARVLPYLRRAHAGGALVLVGDPGRAYEPRTGMTVAGTYDVPVDRALEDREMRRTTVWQLVDDA